MRPNINKFRCSLTTALFALALSLGASACEERDDDEAAFRRQFSYGKGLVNSTRYHDGISVLQPLFEGRPSDQALARLLAEAYVGRAGVNGVFLISKLMQAADKTEARDSQPMSGLSHLDPDTATELLNHLPPASETSAIDIATANNTLKQHRQASGDAPEVLVEHAYYRLVLALVIVKQVLQRFNEASEAQGFELHLFLISKVLQEKHLYGFETVLWEVVDDLPQLPSKSQRLMRKILMEKKIAVERHGKVIALELEDPKTRGLDVFLNAVVDAEILHMINSQLDQAKNKALLTPSAQKTIDELHSGNISPRQGLVQLLQDVSLAAAIFGAAIDASKYPFLQHTKGP